MQFVHKNALLFTWLSYEHFSIVYIYILIWYIYYNIKINKT